MLEQSQSLKWAWTLAFSLLLATLTAVAYAEPRTITIEGKVGSDGSNCYGAGTQACIFGTSHDLSTLDYTLEYTFNDNFGTEGGVSCGSTYGYALYTSTISDSGSSNPGTAKLTIYDGEDPPPSYTFGTQPGQTSITSTATRNLKIGSCHTLDDAYYKVETTQSTGGYSGSPYVWAYVYPTTVPGTLGGDGDWRTAINQLNVDQRTTAQYFYISVNKDGSRVQYAYGHLTPQTYKVVGPLCNLPKTESTSFNGWDSGTPTFAKFLMTLNDLNPSFTASFSGKSVQETSGGTGDDACWDAYHDGTFPPLDGVTGGTWTVTSSNTYGYDYVGYSPGQVSFYRSHGVVPCGTNVYQVMQLYCSADGQWYSYGTTNTGSVNTLHENIVDSTHISSSRAGVSTGSHPY